LSFSYPHLELAGKAYGDGRSSIPFPFFHLLTIPTVDAIPVFHGWTEQDLKPEGAKDLVHEHIGALEIVRGEEVECGVRSVRVGVAAVIADVSI